MIRHSVPLQQINSDFISTHGIKLFVLRLDLNHPYISGNKLYKLYYNLEEAKKLNKKTLLTFGGAFSNHIAATAAAGKENGLKTIGIIRGDVYEKLNPTLKFATDNGMLLHYVSRSLYQNKKELYEYINKQFTDDDIYIIPEGGSNELGVSGCKEIIKNISIDFDHICCACGTGATMAGIILSLSSYQTATGFQVLKAENYITNEINNWLTHFGVTSQNNWSINEDHHFGGYAKVKPELIDFINNFDAVNNIPLDNIYTGKMMFGIYDMIRKGGFKKGQTVVAVHTGGLQGNLGFTYLKQN